ncbi:YNFM family putative membrane transporter [Angulomicrobium tetraedrale]|uniref:YNFM family putative membrane transporter n=1 Tax=Ancylobacter tetraedralis TaxID=217068 RepID=A0A839ZA37_9HYPH|nr:MFS transporter [Ancylobacter tetraedralis]MBB3771578.1 YNFM family putative membrane transporter [Ancylobacter tetraedralis]
MCPPAIAAETTAPTSLAPSSPTIALDASIDTSRPGFAAGASAGWIRSGTVAYRRAGLALFLAGFASFSLIYCVQPLLPAFAHSFALSPAESSLALSLTTGLLALSIVLAGAFSQMLGRRGLMFGSMLLAALLNLAAALAPSWHGLLAARALEGFVLGGVPAVAMAYLAEEIEPSHLGKAMGLYIGGTAFGAMIGRVGMGLMTEFASWRAALGVLGVLCILSAVGFLLLLPRSRHFVPQRDLSLSFHLSAWAGHLRNRALLRLYGIGFLLTSIFVTLFNYSTFRLSGAPYHLSQTQVSMLFLAFGFGIVSSSLAGSLADRFGRRPLVVAGFLIMLAGVLLTMASPLVAIAGGVALVATGFFIGHSVTSSSVGRLAGLSKGHAASLYLLFYYIGSSVTGSIGGWFWEHGGWVSIAALTGALALAGAGLALGLPALAESGSPKAYNPKSSSPKSSSPKSCRPDARGSM